MLKLPAISRKLLLTDETVDAMLILVNNLNIKQKLAINLLSNSTYLVY